MFGELRTTQEVLGRLAEGARPEHSSSHDGERGRGLSRQVTGHVPRNTSVS
jgi:hypothetical protein